jgi:hypothetical protein
MGVRTRRALLLAGLLVYFATIRRWLLHWGSSREERRQPLPGDELLTARWQTTRGVTVSAPHDEVWPWLVQMGYGRGGWYSYDWLERLVGAGDFAEGGSARRVVPELQALAVGDTVALSPSGGLTVAVLDPPNAMVLYYRMNALTAAPAREGDFAIFEWTWAFVLAPRDEVSCRLLTRVRANYRPLWLSVLTPALLEPVHFMMERKMLQTIKRRCGTHDEDLEVTRTPATREEPERPRDAAVSPGAVEVEDVGAAGHGGTRSPDDR